VTTSTTLEAGRPDAGPAAWTKLDAILSAIEGLRDHPCRWPPGRHSGVRERLCPGGWRAYYIVDPDTGRDETAGDVRVLRVYGPGQDRPGFRHSSCCESFILARVRWSMA
jgi:hypothetical protein